MFFSAFPYLRCHSFLSVSSSPLVFHGFFVPLILVPAFWLDFFFVTFRCCFFFAISQSPSTLCHFFVAILSSLFHHQHSFTTFYCPALLRGARLLSFYSSSPLIHRLFFLQCLFFVSICLLSFFDAVFHCQLFFSVPILQFLCHQFFVNYSYAQFLQGLFPYFCFSPS